MTGRPLTETPFLDLLPQTLRHDPDMVALSKTIDVLFAYVHARIDLVRIWSRIDELEEPILSNLAFQMHLEGYEGWHLAESLDQKRALLKDAYKTHFYKGTRWSLERVFSLIDLPGYPTEWWESDEGIEAFPPYTFDMDVFVDEDRTVPATLYTDILNLIDALKNKRSHLRRGTIHVKAPRCYVCFGGATLAHMTVRVLPHFPSRVIVKETVPAIGAATFASSTVKVLPHTPSTVTLRDTSLPTMSAVMTTATVRVIPQPESLEDETM